MRDNTKRKPRTGERPVYLNDKIKAFNIIVINENGERIGPIPRAKALDMASEKSLDLVQVAYNPVEKVSTAKLVDYGKFLYEKKKKDKEQKKTQKQQSRGMKQVKMRYSIGEHDMQLKLEKAKEFIAKGYTVKVLMQLKGRERAYKQRAYDKLVTIVEEFAGVARPQYPRPKEERNGYTTILLPSKGVKNAKSKTKDA